MLDFLEIEQSMATLAGARPSPDHAEAYDRYRQWWRLIAAIRAFVEAASADFGMEPVGVTRRSEGPTGTVAEEYVFRW